MKLTIGWLVLAAAILSPQVSLGQLFFQNSLDEYRQPESRWERWSQTKPRDFIEYRNEKGEVTFRFELVKAEDRALVIKSTKPNPFGGDKPPIEREQRHTFDGPESNLPPGKKTETTITLNGKEIAVTREDFANPLNGQPIKSVYYADEAPFDGMVKYEQYFQGRLQSTSTATYSTGGEAVAATDPPAADEPDEPEEPAAPAPRKWTSSGGNFTIEATLVKFADGVAHLKRADTGKLIQVPLDKLSDADQQFLKDH